MSFRRFVRDRGVLSSLLVVALGPSLSCQPSKANEPERRVQRGAYLVSILACDDCHSPKVFSEQGPVPDGSRRLSGHPAGAEMPPVPDGTLGPDAWGAVTSNDMTVWVGPWGTTFATNLTPHSEGLGLWTEEQFVQSIRTGRHLGVGRPVLPPMPWPAYSRLSNEDLRAIFAYLRTLPPVANVVPQPLPPAQAANSVSTVPARP